MLARTFLPAADLHLSERQRDALVTVLGMMERGEIEHVQLRYKDGATTYEGFSTSFPFNMASWSCESVCGTVHCIGGWAERVGGVDMPRSYQLQQLFYPVASLVHRSCVSAAELYDSITIEQAACALRNYLTLGEPKWSDIIKEPPCPTS